MFSKNHYFQVEGWDGSRTYLELVNSGKSYIKANGTSNYEELLAAIRTNKLLGLKIYDDSIRTECLEQLLNELKDPSHVTELSFEYVELRDVNAGRIGTLLKQNSSIATLWLDRNKITDTSFMTDALQSNKTLTSIAITNQILTEDSIIELAQHLEHNPNVRVLRLRGVGIHEPSAMALARTVAMSKQLSCLDLAQNTVGVNGGMAIVEALVENETLRELNFQSNKLDHAVFQALCHVLGADGNRTLRWLALDGNGIDLEGMQALMKLAEINDALKVLTAAYRYDEGPLGRMQAAINLLLYTREIEALNDDQAMHFLNLWKQQLSDAYTNNSENS